MDSGSYNNIMSGDPLTPQYRALQSDRNGPWRAAIAIARSSLMLLFRRKVFWILYSCAALMFFFYFFGQYLQIFLAQRVSEATVRTGGMFGMMIKPAAFVEILRSALHMDGTADTYGDFMWAEGFILMVVLAFAGSVLVGGDFQHNSLPFYLSKPIGKRHYLFGKALAVGVLINATTTIPAFLLFIEFGFIESWDYYIDNWRLVFGIFAYGLAITVTLGPLLIATGAWLRKTVPIVVVWSSVFMLARAVQRWLVEGLGMSPTWRLIDLWNDLYLFGQWCFGTPHNKLRPTSAIQPEYWQAALVCAAVCILSCLSLQRRTRAVEIVS
jgi:ABC-2 type transport system permease protein